MKPHQNQNRNLQLLNESTLKRIGLGLAMVVFHTLTLFGSDARCFTREFLWSSSGKTFQMSVDLPWDGYDFYSKVPRVFAQYGVYSYEHPEHAVIPEVVSQFQALAKKNCLSEWGTIELAVSFVQQLRYQAEPGEYPKFPMETLADRGGDCEDLSVLLSAILREMGFATRLINPPGHMALGLACKNCDGMFFEADGRKYFYVETTAPGFAIGVAPERYQGTKGRLFRADIQDLALNYLDKAKKRKRKDGPLLYYLREDERRRAFQWDGQVWIASAKTETMNVNGDERRRDYLGGIGTSEHTILPPLAWAAQNSHYSPAPLKKLWRLFNP